ncbi:hypothetical protein ANN_19869 [Periplaneta americana]|uniref:Endonuclease-reverse transcriptase n=1 Tax=Periplaneta americana TaxID=6978 RepID=A0ABQ8SC58_PERAM|nr:hypothetical protein ANN_19869 [Periplaneta americana]
MGCADKHNSGVANKTQSQVRSAGEDEQSVQTHRRRHLFQLALRFLLFQTASLLPPEDREGNKTKDFSRVEGILESQVHRTGGTLSKKLRVEILETCVTPVLLYGCQTWSLTAKLRNSLQICQRKMLRRILGLSLRDKVPNEVLQKMSAIKDPALQATNTKWKWGGHVARLRDGRWT